MRNIGLHLRIRNTVEKSVNRAIRLQLPIFQFFFACQIKKSFIRVDDQLIQQFNQWRKDHFEALFVHASYFINLASLKYDALPLLKHEIDLAKQLSCTHVVLHPGSAAGGKNKQEGIDSLVRAINEVTKDEQDITLVLENTAHGKKSVGSDIKDFQIILDKLDHPERIAFCIDTAHAYCYGYDIKDDSMREQFILLIDKTIGIERVALIHLNDTDQQCGSRIDKHASIGPGNIGQEALKKFVLHPRLQKIPLILELPLLSEEEEDAMLREVQGWHR